MDKISIFDPKAQAYMEVDIETAKLFIESAKEAEKKIAEIQSGIDEKIKELEQMKAKMQEGGAA
jgi:uncharacterized membrane protein (DUF106 family)